MSTPPPSAAEFLYRSPLKPGPRSSQRSSQSFVGAMTLRELERVYGSKLPSSLPKGATVPLPVYLYGLPLPPGAGSWDALPRCTKDRSGEILPPRQQAFPEEMHVILYEYGNSEEHKLAAKAGSKAIPYIPGALSNPYRTAADSTQNFLRMLAPHCLPVSFRLIEDKEKGKGTVLRYREGRGAWNK